MDSCHWSVCQPADVSVPEERHNVTEVDSELERDDIEVDQLSSWPQFVKS